MLTLHKCCRNSALPLLWKCWWYDTDVHTAGPTGSWLVSPVLLMFLIFVLFSALLDFPICLEGWVSVVIEFFIHSLERLYYWWWKTLIFNRKKFTIEMSLLGQIKKGIVTTVAWRCTITLHPISLHSQWWSDKTPFSPLHGCIDAWIKTFLWRKFSLTSPCNHSCALRGWTKTKSDQTTAGSSWQTWRLPRQGSWCCGQEGFWDLHSQ